MAKYFVFILLVTVAAALPHESAKNSEHSVGHKSEGVKESVKNVHQEASHGSSVPSPASVHQEKSPSRGARSADHGNTHSAGHQTSGPSSHHGQSAGLGSKAKDSLKSGVSGHPGSGPSFGHQSGHH